MNPSKKGSIVSRREDSKERSSVLLSFHSAGPQPYAVKKDAKRSNPGQSMVSSCTEEHPDADRRSGYAGRRVRDRVHGGMSGRRKTQA